MTIAPHHSTDGEPAKPAASEAIPREVAPALAGSRARVVWRLPDIFLVGLVGVLTCAAAVTAFRQIQHRRACHRVAAELTAAAAGFRAYMKEQGAGPAPANAGVVPQGMGAYLAGVDWISPTAVGGLYRWVNDSAGESGGATPPAGVIEITAFPRSPPLVLSPSDLLAIDRQIDDGNLSTGDFRTGFNGWPLLRVRTSP